MARTIDEIFQGKMQRLAADATLGVQLTSTSKTAVYRLILYIAAVSVWTLENLHDLFRKEVAETIAAMKPHSLRWYALKAKAFQYGDNLVAESDVYDNTGIPDIDVANRQIVKHSAVIEQEISPNRWGLRIKVATGNNIDLAPLDGVQMGAFQQYMARVKDAGVGLLITTGPPDSLLLQLKIYYNPLVLDGLGQRLDGTENEPVQKAIKRHLTNLPFNGKFNLTHFIDALQQVDGVDDPRLIMAQATYGALAYADITDEYTPDAGYLRILNEPTDLLITWLPKIV